MPPCSTRIVTPQSRFPPRKPFTRMQALAKSKTITARWLELPLESVQKPFHEPQSGQVITVSFRCNPESISNRGLANEVNGLSFLCPQVEVAETEDANGLPILDQGRTVRISPRFEMLSEYGQQARNSHRRVCRARDRRACSSPNARRGYRLAPLQE